MDKILTHWHFMASAEASLPAYINLNVPSESNCVRLVDHGLSGVEFTVFPRANQDIIALFQSFFPFGASSILKEGDGCKKLLAKDS